MQKERWLEGGVGEGKQGGDFEIFEQSETWLRVPSTKSLSSHKPIGEPAIC